MSFKPIAVASSSQADLLPLASTKVLGANDTLRVGVIGAGGRMRTILDCADKTGIPYEIVAVSDVYGPRRDEVKARTASTAATTTHRRLSRSAGQGYRRGAHRLSRPLARAHGSATRWLQAKTFTWRSRLPTPSKRAPPSPMRFVRSKQILQCGMQQRSWTHFRNAVDLIQGGSLGRVTQVRTYWWQNYNQAGWKPKPVDTQALDWKLWLGGAPDQPFSEEKFYRWRWYWNFGGGAMTDLFTHWIDVAHWAMKSDTPREAQMLADKYIFVEWDCPDTVQAALRYPGWDVVYEGMMSSSIDDGGLEFRGTEATLKINRNTFGIYREGLQVGQNPILSEDSFRDGTIDHVANFFACVKSRKEPNAPVETGIAAARAGHIANLAYKHTGQIVWPPKNSA